MSGRMPVSDSPVDAADIGVADERPDPDLDQVVTAGPAGPLSARNAAIAVGLVVAALIAVLAWGGGGEVASRSPLIGNRVPELAGTDLDGRPYDIDDRRGRWVVVNFFATWCPPCVAEHPELLALSEWGRSRGDVELVTVVFNEPDPEPVRRFFAERGGDWPVVYGASSVPIDFQMAQVPETFVVAPSGLVVAHVSGETTAEEMIAVITAMDEDSPSGGGS